MTARPCARCGDNNRCSVTLDGAVAVCRTQSAWTDEDIVKRDRCGEEFIFIRGDHGVVVPPVEPEDGARLAPPDVLDRVYSDLRALQREGGELLDGHDLVAMQRRGVDHETVTRWGYWSFVPGVSEASRRLFTKNAADVFGVPGIYEKRMVKGTFIAGTAGLAIPVRDPIGRIIRVRVRYVERVEGGKEKKAVAWLSSPQGSEHTGVPATAAAHVPLHGLALRTGEVWVTEGEIKADIATMKLGKLVVSIPGTTLWDRVMPVLRELEARRVVLAFDGDARTNPGVSGALQRLAAACAAEGYEIAVATWAAEHKGLDDVLVALGSEAVTVHDGVEAVSRIRELVDSSGGHADPAAAAELLVRAAVSKAKDFPRAPFERDVLAAAALLRRVEPGGWAEIKALVKKQGAPPVREWERAIKADAFRRAAEKRVEEEGPRSVRTKVRVSHDESVVVDQVITVLARDAEQLYARAGSLVRVLLNSSDALPLPPRIDAIPRESLRETVSRHVEFFREVEKDDGVLVQVPEHPPRWCVDAVHARGDWQGIRTLVGVVDAPVLRRDGSVLDEPGYDDSTQYLYIPSREFGRAPAQPTFEQGKAALERLADVVSEFLFDPTGPYEEPDENRRMHLAAALALPLTLVARPMIRGATPAFMIDGPDSSAGKTNLAETLAALAMGSKPTPKRLDPDEDEWSKAFFATLREGSRAILFDNIPTGGVFGHAALDAALTQWPVWSARILGQSTVASVPNNAVIIATGNNPRVPNDTIRRLVRIRLLKRSVERDEHGNPKEREWKYQLPNQATELATETAIAAATALRAYIVAGMPRQRIEGWGSFTEWAALIPQCLAWYGYPDIRRTQDALREVEESALGLDQMLRGWEILDARDEGLSPAQVLSLASQNAAPPDIAQGVALFRAGLEEIDPRKFSEHTARTLGRILGKYRGKVVDGRAFERAQRTEDAKRWRVETSVVAGTRSSGTGGYPNDEEGGDDYLH